MEILGLLVNGEEWEVGAAIVGWRDSSRANNLLVRHYAGTKGKRVTDGFLREKRNLRVRRLARSRWKGPVEGYEKGHMHFGPNFNRLQMAAV